MWNRIMDKSPCVYDLPRFDKIYQFYIDRRGDSGSTHDENFEIAWRFLEPCQNPKSMKKN
jgi:hypothetical protein